MLCVINRRFICSSSKLGSLWFDLFHKSQPIWKKRTWCCLAHSKDAWFSLLCHLTQSELSRAKTVIQDGVTPAPTSPPPHFFSHTTPSRFHNDGRMLDVFQRLTSREGTYFLPQDLELSNQELSYIVKKAEQWRGFNGERRKVSSLSCLSRQCSSLQTQWLIGLMDVFLTRENEPKGHWYLYVRLVCVKGGITVSFL